MEIILVVVVGVSLIAMTGLYMYLVDEEEIQPYIPTKIQRGNFWDAETQKFYKWDELVELQKQREINND
jgi:hypothetical protein